MESGNLSTQQPVELASPSLGRSGNICAINPAAQKALNLSAWRPVELSSAYYVYMQVGNCFSRQQSVVYYYSKAVF